MSSSKKRGKDDQIPKPISIKKEKSEEDRTLQPISHYIDDRLELVKQIFVTLKPKTIMNLAPEFLKKNNLDEIEELCLNELLCVSTKRLKSIIADTRCPTDTESSEDSDVERKEEHISLEEISSDSDIGASESRRAKKLRKSNAKRADKTNENKEPADGQISVLELLELQARARAIRSQLALEPITKIEVKSDDDEKPKKDKSKDKRGHKSNPQSSKRRSSERTTSKQQTTNGSNAREASGSAPAPAAAPTKKIKLKRNYRTATKSPEKEPEIKAVPAKTTPESNRETNKSRSASPDVIPIPAEPETLLISDSTDDEDKQLAKKPVEPPQPTVLPAPAAGPVVESEPEEGEVREDSETEAESQTTAQLPEQAEVKPLETETETQAVTNVATETPAEVVETEEAVKESQDTTPNVQDIAETENAPVVDDEDQNDDVISIGGDLEHEMIEELSKETEEPAVKVENEQLVEPDDEDNDVISLNTSEDEHVDKPDETSSESWRTRYLKSSKVNQVLAASRLGKRVRDKIKESKRAQKKHNEAAKALDDEKASQQQQQQTFSSKHEDGSMEQYQELLQHRQRKSSNASKSDK